MKDREGLRQKFSPATPIGRRNLLVGTMAIGVLAEYIATCRPSEQNGQTDQNARFGAVSLGGLTALTVYILLQRKSR